jgi:PAS domain S-box-containing protein
MTATVETGRLRVVIADDSPMLRRRLQQRLGAEPRIEIVGLAGDAPSTIALVQETQPDAVVLDLRMPGGGGLRVLEEVKRNQPAPTVVVLTNYPTEEYRDRCLTLGADEFLDKSGAFERVTEALLRVPDTARTVTPTGTTDSPADALRAALDGIEDAILVLDESGTVVDANAAWRRRDGGEQSPVGSGFADALTRSGVVCAATLATLEVGIRDVVEGSSDHAELSYSCADRAAVEWYRVRARSVNVRGHRWILLALRNVTATEVTAQALRDSERKFRLLAENARDVVYRYRLAPNRGLEYVSPSVEAMTGYRPEECYADPDLWPNLVGASGWSELIREFDDRTYGARPVLRQATRRDGRVIWAEMQNTILRDAGGQPVAVEGIARDVTERAAAEHTMRLQSAALEAAYNAVVIARADGTIEWVNPAFTRLTGYEASEVVGRTPRLLRSGRQDRAFYRRMWDTILRGDVWTGELVNRRRDGSLYDERMTITPVRNAEGAVTHFIAIKEDVSARRAAELALQESEARFRAVAESASDGILVADADGRVVYANRRAESMFGLDGDGGGVSLNDLMPAGDGVGAPASPGEPGANGGQPVERVALRRDGTTFPVELSLNAWTRGDRRFSSAIVRDISTRKRTDQALKESEERYRATFSRAPVGIVHVATDGRYIRVNPQFADIVGYTVDELLRMGFQDVTHPDDLEANAAGLGAVANGRRPDFRVEKRYLHKSGAVVWARLSVSAVRDERGAVEYLIEVVENMTERRLLEQQLYQAQKMEAIGRLAGGVAHDFNNLLTIIRGESEMALADLAADHPARECLAGIRQAGDRAALLTSRLLAFSRKQVVEATTFSAAELVQDAERMLRRLLEENITITTRISPEPALIRADRGQLEQVLVNLVVNARDAMPAGGTISIGTSVVELDAAFAAANRGSRPGRYVLLEVSDTGVGMSEDTKAHLFEPFFTTKPRGKGTGLGLATCFGIVKQAGGYVAVESAIGAGTTMRVYLPVAVPSPTPSDAERPNTSGGGWETVLLVEDEDAVRAIARRILAAEGYTVLEAADGEAALDALDSHPGTVHLVLTDVVMPRVGGWELAVEVRDRHPGVRILFMSGYTDDSDLRRLVEREGATLVHKPFSRDELLRKVRVALDEEAA